MKKILSAGIIIISIATWGYADDINTGQMTQLKHDGHVAGADYPLPVSALPYAGCNYAYHEASGTLTDHAIVTVGTGHTIRVYGIEVHSLDLVNKGVVRFEDSDNATFYAGYLGTAPSAFGTQVNFATNGITLKVTTSGATAIVIHYVDVYGGI